MIEVEKKFKVPADFQRTLLDQGWQFVKEIRFTDTYFDSASYELSQSEHWLRQRDKKWQLKCPARSDSASGLDSVRIDKYIEIEDNQAIIDRLALVFKTDFDCSSTVSKTTNNVIENMFGLKPMAEFETSRVEYKLHEFAVDLDQTNFGYGLGEIEVMCKHEKEMDEVTAKIFDMASKLGVDIHSPVTGKVGTYLKMNNKLLYDQLVSKGILVAEIVTL